MEETNFTDLVDDLEETTIKTVASKEIISINSATLFSSEDCDKIKEVIIEELWMKIKVVGDLDIHSGYRQKLRGNISEFPFQQLKEITKEANDKVYDFDLLGIIDQDYPQVFRYSENSFCSYHVEINPYAPSRKLTFIVNLSNEDSYQGGHLEFLNTTVDANLMNGQGNIIIFPSFLPYQITKVTQGEKLVIVGHIHGPLFR